MLKTVLFVVFLIVLSIILEIKTHQRRRVIVASSSLYVFVLYYFLFEVIKDQQTIKLLIQIRPDLLIDTIQPIFVRILSYNPFEGNVFFLRLLNLIGIKEGTRLYIFITTYRPLASDSPFTGISIDSTLTFLKNSLPDYFDWKVVDRYFLRLKKIAWGYVVILCDQLEKIKFMLSRTIISIKNYYMIAWEHNKCSFSLIIKIIFFTKKLKNSIIL